MAMVKVREDSQWAKKPLWKRRISGFAAYLMAAFASLVWPVEVDKAMYATLRDQFD